MKFVIWTNRLCTTYRLVLHNIETFLLKNQCSVVNRSTLVSVDMDVNNCAKEADFVLMATCGGFYSEIDNFLEAFDAYAKLGKKIIVYGCLPRIIPDRYKDIEPKVFAYIDTRHPEDIARYIDTVIVPWNSIPAHTTLRTIDCTRVNPQLHYVVIQEGCDAKCTFCPHKLGIGPRRSVSLAQIQSSIKEALAQGAQTILLEGRDSGSWGVDMTPATNYPTLLKELLSMRQKFDLFLNQLGANWAIKYKEELLEIFADKRITDAWIPIQTTSPRLLRIMGRDPNVLYLENFLKEVNGRAQKPILKTDMLIGFPTETQAEFTETLHFVAKYFDEVSLYGFELHSSSSIANANVDFVEPYIIQERVQEAANYLSKFPNIIWHSAGQDLKSEVMREQRKIELGRK